MPKKVKAVDLREHDLWIPKDGTYPENVVEIAELWDDGYVSYALHRNSSRGKNRIRISAFLQHFRPVTDDDELTEYKRCKFVLADEYDAPLNGWASGRLWNGWQMPYATKKQLKAFIAKWRAACGVANGSFYFDDDGALFAIVDSDDNRLPITEQITLEQSTPEYILDNDGKEHEVYALGGWMCWDKYD